MVRNSDACTACGRKTYYADVKGRCPECSSICYYCGKSRENSGQPVEVISHLQHVYLAHQSCHDHVHATESP